MKIAANFVIGGIVFTGLIIGGAILGCFATYGLCKDEIDAGREALASKRAREEYKKYAWGRYPWGSEQHNTDESEETAE